MEKVYLTIKREELLKIIKGEKIEEYRALSIFNCKRLLIKEEVIENGKKKTYGVRNPEVKQIYFRSGMAKDALMAVVEVLDIRTETFMNFIPESFSQGDSAITIYLGKVLESNL